MTHLHKLIRSPYRGKLKACILDWSGTTLDAYVIAPAVAFVEVFKKWGVPISMEEARKPMGLRKDIHIKALLDDPDIRKRWEFVHHYSPTQEDVDSLFEDFIPYQKKCLSDYTELLPETKEVVDCLQKTYGLKIGSTTGFSRDMVDIIMCKAKEQGYVPDVSVAGDDLLGENGVRPKPFMIYENLKQMGIHPIQSVVKVDDTIAGIGESVAAGCWGVGIAAYSNYMGIDTIEQFENMSIDERTDRLHASRLKLTKDSNAHYVIDTLNELPSVIDDINRRLSIGENP